MQITKNGAAILLMLAGALASSFFALIVVWRETENYPFWFAFWHNTFAFLSVIGFVWIFQPRLLKREVISAVLNPPKVKFNDNAKFKMNLTILPCIVSGVGTFPLFSIATKYIDIIPAVLIFEMATIFLVILNGYLFRKTGKYRPLTLGTWVLLGLGLVGFGFVTLGQTGSVFSSATFSFAFWLGGILVFFAAFCDALSPAFSLKHGMMARQKIKAHVGHDIEETFCTMISLGVHRLIAGVVSFAIALYLNEPFAVRGIEAGFLTGAVIAAITGITLRWANMLTHNLGVNAIAYTTPLFAVMWLLLFTDHNFASVDLVVIGAFAIIAANVLINFKAETHLGYKALVISLWLFGMVVYFREGAEFGDYYNAAMISATMFILILSFRTNRLVRRTATEKEIVLSLWRRIPTIFRGATRRKNILDLLSQIEASAKSNTLHITYGQLKSYFARSTGQKAEVAAQIDKLFHSKQQGVNFGESLALFILALITVVGLLFFLPTDASGWSRFFAEMSAFLLSATVVFLYCGIWDLQKDRNRPVLEDKVGIYSVASLDNKNRALERWLSVVVCTGITFSYAWFLCVKWLGESPLDIVCQLLVGIIRTPLCSLLCY